MNSIPATGKHFVKLVAIAALCAMPFLLFSIYLVRHVQQVDTLPFDEYRDLRWAPSGHGVLFLHEPLAKGKAGSEASVEIWFQDVGNKEFRSLGTLPTGSDWTLTPHTLGAAVVFRDASDSGPPWLAQPEAPGEIHKLEVESGWEEARGFGTGLFYVRDVKEVPFEQFADVEPAPEMMSGVVVEGWPPTQSGVEVASVVPETYELKTELVIPYAHESEFPRILGLMNSPDSRFLAMVLAFGEEGRPGLWVYDRQTSRLLWTRVVTGPELYGLAWSPDSMQVAVSDDEGLVLLTSALGIEFTRYKADILEQYEVFWLRNDLLVLSNGVSLMRFSSQTGEAETMVDTRVWPVKVGPLVLEPQGRSVATLADPTDGSEILWDSLLDEQDKRTGYLLPGSLRLEAQENWTYRLGDVVRQAWRYWF